MSWLYSIVFAGLLFSSNSDTTVKSNRLHVTEVPAAEATVVSDEIEKFEQTYPLTANGRVSVSNVNGSIVVEAWDRNEVKLEATKIGDSKEALADVEIKVDAQADSFRVEADYGTWKRDHNKGWKNHRKLEVQFRLSVPRTAFLDEVETVNGSVTVSNFVALTKISAVNGNVSAANLRGNASLSTVNGEVIADFDRLETGSKISLSTVNGKVNLLIPSDANATIKADSLNGSITNDFGLPVRKGQYVGRDMYGRVGSGDVQIKLNSVNGGLSVGRKNDGKSVNPATNLLPQKNKSDDDWDENDDESDGAVNSARVDREVVRAVRDSDKHAAIALKEARKEIHKIKPELAKVTRESVKAVADAVAQTAVVMNSDEFKQQLKDAIKVQNETLSRIDFANFNPGAPFIEKKTNSFQVKGTPKVVIEAKGCGVRVRGWDKPEVKYVLTEIAGSRNRNRTTVNETQTDAGVTLTVQNDHKDSNERHYYDRDRVRIDVFVPKNSNLKIVTNGEIRLDGVSGEIELIGENEAIDVRDVDGRLHLSAGEAQVRVIGFRGAFDSKTECGDVYLEGDFDKLSAKATDGTITVTVPEGTNASFASNTDIETDGLELNGENGKTLRLGSGGTTYNFNFTDGKLVVRGASLLNSY